MKEAWAAVIRETILQSYDPSRALALQLPLMAQRMVLSSENSALAEEVRLQLYGEEERSSYLSHLIMQTKLQRLKTLKSLKSLTQISPQIHVIARDVSKLNLIVWHILVLRVMQLGVIGRLSYQEMLDV